MFSLILIHLFPDPCGNFCYVLRVDLYSVLDIGDQLITYIEDGVNINTKNVTDVTARIREKMNNNL